MEKALELAKKQGDSIGTSSNIQPQPENSFLIKIDNIKIVDKVYFNFK